jgi:drug/metabolite transporter (DMT)-like permease
MRWVWVALIVISTTVSDLLQSSEMKKQGAKKKFGLTPLLGIAVVAMAVSFFSLLKLLQSSDMSFAIPATAASLFVETLLAGVFLKERVTPRRWIGALLVAIGVLILGQS